MTKSDGKCNIDGVSAGEISINLLGPVPTILAKYALESTKSGERFGAGIRAEGWSEETLTKLKAFIDSLEGDVCKSVFDAHTSGSVAEDSLGTTDGVPGF